MRKLDAAKVAAKHLWSQLSAAERGILCEDLVCGGIDWMDWFIDPPPRGVWREIEKLMLYDRELIG